jgi:hypothetical protein
MPCRYILEQCKSWFDLRTKTKKLGHRNVVIQHLSTFWTGSTCVRTDKKQPASEKFLYILSIYCDTDSVSDIQVSPLDTKVPLEGHITIGTIRRSAKLRRLWRHSLLSSLHRLKICARDTVHISVSKLCWYVYHLLSAINHTCGVAFKAYAI